MRNARSGSWRTRSHVPTAFVSVVGVLILAATFLVALPRPASAAPADEAPPATIRVCRTTYGNGEVVEVPFDEYVKTVLPYEYDSSYGEAYREYFRAGAVAVKSYAWWWVRHPYSSDCHLTDGGRHQHYNPGQTRNRRTAVTDQAVDDTWHVRLEDGDTGEVAFAQYCSCRGFPEGRHIQQTDARNQAASGWSYVQILDNAYRNLPGVITDWRDGLAISLPSGPFPFGEGEEPLRLEAQVAGVAPGDGRVLVTMFALCTIDGVPGPHKLQSALVGQDDNGNTRAVFDDLGRVDACAEQEVALSATLTVNGWLARSAATQAWRPWRSASARDVTRLAPTNDPVRGSVAVSEALFSDHDSPEAQSTTLTDAVPGNGEESQEARTADAVVLARSDVFADALAASGLAGTRGPILLNPGGPDSQLDEQVGAEIERILAPGQTVYVIGGEAALSPAVTDELEDRGYRTVRLSGSSRIDTALVVASHLRQNGAGNGRVLVARALPDSSTGWADAVTVGSYAAATGTPLLLTGDATLDSDVERWIEDPDNGVEEAILIGGTRAVPADAEQRLDGVMVRRVRGRDRAATAVAVADTLWSGDGMPEATAALIVDTFDDGDWGFAVAAAVFGAVYAAPQLAVTDLVPRVSTGSWLDGRENLPAVVVGGPRIVPDRVAEELAGDG